MRLPNTASFLVYAFFCYKLVVKNTKSLYSSMLACIFLMLNPYMIEYFSLSRGYGLALAFFSGSLYYFFKASQDLNAKRYLTKAILFSILTIYSNYSFITAIVGLHFGFIVIAFSKEKWKFFSRNKIPILILEIIVLYPAFYIVKVLKKNNQIYIGGNKNIIEDTIFSLISSTFQIELIPYQNLVLAALFLVVLAIGVRHIKQNSITFLYILLLCVGIFPIMLHFLSRYGYPIGRTALYWIIIIGYLFHEIHSQILFDRNILLKSITSGIMTLFCGLILINFFYTANFSHTYSWKYDASTKKMLAVLNTKINHDKTYTMSINSNFSPVIDYYRKTKNYKWLKVLPKNHIGNQMSDFYYVEISNKIPAKCQKIIRIFQPGGTKLVENCGS